MNSRKLLMAGIALGATAALLAAAPPGDTPNKPDPSNKRPDKNAKLLRASEILGYEVRASNGDDVGEIEDIAIDPSCACARFATVSHGGVLGVGGDTIAVPMKAFRFGSSDEQFVTLNIDKTRFEQAPKFTGDDWNKFADKTWTATVYQHYNISDREIDKTASLKTPPVKIMQASNVVGMDVHNHNDDDLGEIEDLMLDVNSGRIGYAVISFGGVLGINEKLFAVPWQALKIDSADDKLLLNVEKEKLANAPGFDKNDWPDMADLNWSRDVHAFYGSDPNWIYGYAEEDDQDGQDPGENGHGWGATSAYNQKFNSSAVQNYRGTITDMSSAEPMDGMSDAAVMTLRTDRGEELTIHLGPDWFVDNQERQFNEDEQVEVSGCRIDLEGKPVIMAIEVKRGSETLRLRDRNGRPFWAAWHGTENPNNRTGTNRDFNN